MLMSKIVESSESSSPSPSPSSSSPSSSSLNNDSQKDDHHNSIVTLESLASNLITTTTTVNSSPAVDVEQNDDYKRFGNSNNKASKRKSKENRDESNDVKCYCICRRPEDEEEDGEDMMINCDVCDDWLHGRCINLNHRLAADIEKYVCPRCVSAQRPIVYKTRHNYHRHDYSDPHAQRKPVQAGTPVFIADLLKRRFPDALEQGIVKKLDHGQQLTLDYLREHGFDRPLLVENKSELDFVMPSSDQIDLGKIEDIVGGDYSIDVIDVERQLTFPMSIGELNSYFKATDRTKVYNLISFEISKTKLTQNITAPRIVHDISWVSNGVWPDDDENSTSSSNGYSVAAPAPEQLKQPKPSAEYVVKPEVQKYCLISAANSYTDFHIDFGGSSVWYHTVKGDKVFYLIEPTDENLSIYEKWASSKNQTEIFLGDKVKNCYKFEIKAGNTIFLPSGWIHAVYTPSDSLVFGGNFLQSFSIPLQIKIYEIEQRCKTPEKFRFPAFETLQWYAGKYYTQKLKEQNESKKDSSSSTSSFTSKFLVDLKYLFNTLKKWANSKEFYELHDYQIPRKINCDKLIKHFSKELTKAECLLKANDLARKETAISSSQSITNRNGEKEEEESKKMYIDGNSDETSDAQSLADLLNGNSNNKAKEPEVVCFKNMELLEEVRFGGEEDEELNQPLLPTMLLNEPIKQENPEHQQQQPVRLVMKLPKQQTATKSNEEEEAKPVKLKLKLTNVDIQQQPTAKLETSNHKQSKKHAAKPSEDDELIKDLKNAYCDDDFVYPSLNEKSMSRQRRNGDEDLDVSNASDRPTRKRKLKPHAIEYLTPKQPKLEEPAEPAAPAVSVDEKTTKKKPKSLYAAMIEKNLHPQAVKTNIKPPKEKKAPKKKDAVKQEQLEKVKDKDFALDDEEAEDDEDIDFKINCKQNLKLSKKLKKTTAKLMKEKEGEEESLSPTHHDTSKKLTSKSSSGSLGTASNSTTTSTNGQKNPKKLKKGFATAKQRLGKLLKLNRVVNI